MSAPEINQKIPDCEVKATSDRSFKLSDLQGKKLVLYFYPKDSTPGCTTEGRDFSSAYKEFQKSNCEILGASRDSLTKHENFKEKQQFPFDLISDPDEALCKLFDVIHEKNLYGKKHMGIVRSTFVIDEKGILRQEYRKVKVKGHVEEVLECVKSL
ncbi:MAG: peroxiredoxin [Arenicellales bacterium]|jgi:peroxiredoxin Q/BCP